MRPRLLAYQDDAQQHGKTGNVAEHHNAESRKRRAPAFANTHAAGKIAAAPKRSGKQREYCIRLQHTYGVATGVDTGGGVLAEGRG